MIFKEEKMREDYWKLSPRLRLILAEIDHWSIVYGNEDSIVTCLLRTPEEQMKLFESGQAPAKTSVHCYGRGADLRIFKSDILNQSVLEWVNDKWLYDGSRPNLKTMIRHEGTGDHYHVQTLA